MSLSGVSTISGWSVSDTSKNEYLCMKVGKNAYLVSAPFGVPESCEVVVTIPMYAYGGSIASKYNPTVYASATSATSGSAAGTSIKLSGSNKLPNGGASYTNWTPTVVLSDTAPRVSIYSTGSGSSWSVGGGDMGVIMKSIDIKYKI